MTVTVLKLSDADTYLKNISIKNIKDVRALDVDLMLVLRNGDSIIISNGAVSAMSAPESSLQFADGKLPLASVFQQIEKIDVSPEANLTVSSKEITRYNQNNARNKKARKDDEEAADKPVVIDDGEHDPRAAAQTSGSGGNTEQTNFTPTQSPDNQSQIADAEINSQHEKNWGVQWPIAAGALALLAAAGGGGGGGGSNGGSAANGSSSGTGAGGGAAATASGGGAGTVDPSAAVIRGSAALGAIKNANVTAYDAFGNALSDTVAVIDGKYTLTLKRALYKGPMMLVVRDNTPGLADNYIDEATLQPTDLGNMPLRNLVMASGVNQNLNVTALTELAVLKAGLDQGLIGIANQPEITAERIIAANNAVSGFFKVDILGTDVVATSATHATGRGIPNPGFTAALSVETQNYGAALKAIANLVRLDKNTYPNQASALSRLADSLDFVDEAGSGLKWATNTRGQTLAKASALQGALLSEPLTQVIDNPDSSEEAVETAQRTLDALQNLPNGSTVADYLINNHVAIPNPVITIRNAVLGNPLPWQTAPLNSTLVLDQGDLLDGDLRVKTTPNAKVAVIIKAVDNLGHEISVSLPMAHADASGIAILKASDENMEVLQGVDRNRAISAQVTVTDGSNSRTNHALWSSSNIDVRVDLNTPESMTRFAEQNPLSLLNDTFYDGSAVGDSGRFPAANQGGSDRITHDSRLRIVLNKAYNPDSERVQWAIATGPDRHGNPAWDNWREVNGLTEKGSPAPGRVVYETGEVSEVNGPIWVKVRIVQKGVEFTGGYGNANTLETPLQFTLDKLAPTQVRLRLVAGLDDGVASDDGITGQLNSRLELAAPREGGTELHVQLQTGDGSTNDTLAAVNTAGVSRAIAPGSWIILKADEHLVMRGDTKNGNGKAALKLRHIDAAGNYNEFSQTFVTDSTGTIELVNLLVQRQKVLTDASTARAQAKTAFDTASVTERTAKQALLAAALRVEEAARKAHDEAVVDVRKALTTAREDGSYRLDDVLGQSTDVAYLPAIVNQLSRATNVEKINHQAGLKDFVADAKQKADTAVTKASLYGDDPANPAPDSEDFFAMGVLGLGNTTAMAAVVDAIRELPKNQSNSINKIQAITDAYLKVLALANEQTDTSDTALPAAAVYAILGVKPALSPAAATILGNVLDSKKTQDVDTVAKLSAIAEAAQRIAVQAVEEKPASPPTVEDFKKLGINGVTADNLAAVRSSLFDVPPALKDASRPDKVVGTVDTLREVIAIVEFNIGDLRVLINYANGKSPINPDAPLQTEPTVDNYRPPSVLGLSSAVTPLNLASINSALRAVGGLNVDSWKKVIDLAASYERILSSANGIAGDAPALPTLDDFVRVGVKALTDVFKAADGLDTAGQASAARLLAEVIDGSARSKVATVPLLDTLADIAARAVHLAKQGDTVLSAAELKQLLNVDLYDDAQMAIIRSGITGTKDDGTKVNSVQGLKDVIDKALAAAAKIRAYADDASKPAPAVDDYRDLGIAGIDSALKAAALNSSLATDKINGAAVTSPAALQTIADAYLRILGEAGDVAKANLDPLAADYTAIGVDVSLTANAAQLLNSVLHKKTPEDVGTVNKVTLLAQAAADLHALVKGMPEAEDAVALTTAQLTAIKTQLTRLGVSAPDDAVLPAVIAALRLSPADGEKINTLDKLQQLADKAADAQRKINLYADDASKPTPVSSDYSDMGVDKVTASNLDAINSALATPVVESAQTASPKLVQGIVSSYARILAAADGVAGNATTPASAPTAPTAVDYERVGIKTELVTKLKEGDYPLLALLNTLVDATSKDKVHTVALLQERTEIADKIIAQVRGATGDSRVSLQELEKIGITGLQADTFSAVLSALAASKDDGSEVIGQISGTLRLQQLANKAHAAMRVLENYADNKQDVPEPTSDTYKDVGLDLSKHLPLAGSAANAVSALNSALHTTAVTKAQVNPPTKLKEIIDSYQKVLAAANGAAPADGSLSPEATQVTAEGLGKLGITGLAGASEDLLANVQAVVDGMAREKALDVANLQKTVDIVSRISRLADGTAGNATDADKFTDAIAELEAVGITVTDPVVAQAAVSAIDAVRFSDINSPKKLRALVEAYERILQEANENPRAAGAPPEDKQADATPTADPGVEHFRAIGVKVTGVTETPVSPQDQAARLRLLDDALKYRTRSEVDTVGELTTLGKAVDAFMTLAAQAAGSTTSVTAEQWQAHAHALGIAGIDTDTEDGNLNEVLAAIRNKGVNTIDSIIKLRDIVQKVNASVEVIAAYAENNTHPAPTVENYTLAGIITATGVPLVTNDNLAAINSAIDKLNRDDVSTRRLIKAVVNAYNAILTAADGEAFNDSGATLPALGYLTIGVPLGSPAIGMGTLVVRPDGSKNLENVDLAKLALFNNVVGSRNKPDVSTPDKLEALAKTVADLIRTGREQENDAVVNAGGTALSIESLRNLGLSAIDTPVRRTAFLNAVKYKGNGVDTATGEPKTGDADSHKVDGIDTLAKLKRIAASYKTILDHVGAGESATAPTREDYLNIGVQLPAHGGQHALQLFNSAIAAQASDSNIDDISKLNKLALTVDKLMQIAAVTKVAEKYPDQYPEVAITLEADALAKLGLKRMNEASVALLLAKLQTTADDGSGAARIQDLQKMADDAVAAQARIFNYAETNTGTAPTVADFEALGLALPRNQQDEPTPYLNAINDALRSQSIDGSKANTPAQLQKLITAAQHVVDAANGNPNDATPKPNEADFLALGLDPQKIRDAKTTGIAFLADTVDASTIDQLTKDSSGAPIALPDRLAQLLDLIQSLINTVAGRPANPPLSQDTLSQLGVQFQNLHLDSNGKLTNWPAIRAAIAGSKGDGSEVNSLIKLRGVVEKADTSQETLRQYAQTNIGTAPTVEDYKNIGLVRIPADPDAVRSPLVSTDNVAAVNAALRTVKVTAANADTPEHLKEVVDAYLAILARANGPAADTGTALTPDHFKRIGADITGVTDDSTSPTNAAVRSLLDSVIGSKLPADVDTPAKIERLGVLVNKVIAQARTQPGDTQPDQITAAELAELGIAAPEGSLTDAANAPAVLAALYAIRFGADDGTAVDNFTELRDVVRKAMIAYKKIQTYAALNDIPAGFPNDADRPNADDFEAMGLVAPASVKADLAVGAAASLATAHIGVADIDTPEKLLKLLQNWDKLLTLPDGQPNQPLAAATRDGFKTLLTAVGAPVAAGTSDAALDLLHSALDVMGNTAHMNTPARLLALLGTTQAITDLAGHPQALSAAALPVGLFAAELIKLGLLPEAATSTNGAAASVLGAIAAQAGPAEVDNMAELRPLATLALAAHARITAYADNATAPAPTAADYAAIGLVKNDAARTPLVTTADNLGAVNSALASAPINAARADDPSLLKTIIDAYQSIIDWHNGGQTMPVSGAYEAIGVTGLNPNAKTLLDGGVRKLPLENVKHQANLQKAADVAAHIVTLADGTANSEDNSLPLADDYAALGLDMGHSSRALDADGSGAALLGSVLDRKSWTDINSLDKLQTLADTVNKLMDKAASRTAPLPTADDFKALGVDISGKTAAQKEAILAAVGTSGTDGQAIKSVHLLEELVTKAITALAKIEAYAGTNTGDVPTADDYKAMGVADVDANNLAAVNAALASVKVGAPEADTQPEVQAIVNAYRKILAAADGVRESVDPVGTDLVPTAAELDRIGVNLAPNTPPSQISLLATALDAVARNKVDTPAKIEIINASAARLIGAAGHAADADALQLSDFENLGVNGLSEDVMISVRGLISTSAVENINTSTRLQTAIDGLLKDLKLIRNYADNKPNEDATLGPTGVVLEPAVHNYANAGVQHVTATNLVSMNAAVKAQGNGQKVDSKLKLQAIADAYNHILQAADGVAGNVATPITRAELVTIGLADNVLPDPDKADSTPPQKALARATLGLLLTALDAQPSDGSTVKTPALIGDLLALAGKVAQFAATNTATAPTLADLEKLGVRHLLGQQGPIASTLLLVNDALGRTPADALSALDLGKVQTIATAAYKLRMLTTNDGVVSDSLRPTAEARDPNGLPTTGAPLTRAELLALGMQIEDKPANIKLLNEALDNQRGFGTVSDVNKLNDLNLADIVNRVMKLAASDLAAPAVVITTAEWARLGITSTGTGAVVNGDSLAAFEAALKLHQPADMDTLAELRELASAAHTALNKIRDYAQSAADGVVAPANSAGLPTLPDFKAIGVTGVDRYNSITPDRPDPLPEGLFALLSSLASAAISGAEAATHTQIQQIVDSYNKVLALADGTANLALATAPEVADYTRIGSNLGNVATKPGYLTLLNSVIDPLTAQQIDTPAEITALADKVSKVLGYAGSISTGSATPAPAAPQRDDFTGLGITGLEAADLPAVLARLSRIDNIETAGITRLAGLQEMVTKAVQAQAKVRNYADSNVPADAPTQQDYLDMGVLMPNRPEINDYAALMLGALNSTLAAPLVTRAQANTPQQLEAILALYHGKLLPMADGRSNTPSDKLLTVADLDLLGVNTTQFQLTEAKHLRLFNDMVDNMPDAASVAQVSHLNVLAARAAKVIAIADQAPGDLVADANKFSVEDYRYFIGQNAALQPLDEVAITYALQSKTSGDVLTVQTTKDLMVQAPLAYAKIRNYADGVGAAPVPTGEDYRILGISDVREVTVTNKPANLAALHAVLELPAINAASVNPPGRLQAIVNSYNKLLAQANGTPADTADDNLAGLQDFKNIGINMVRLEAMSSEQSGNAIKLLSSIIDSRGVADIDTPAKIQNFVTLSEKVALLVKGDRSQPLNVADFTALNIPGVKDSNIEQVRNKIDGLRDDGLDSNTWSKLADAVFTVTNVPSLNPVTADNIINKAEREAGVTLTGTAGSEDRVTLRFEDGSIMKSDIVTVDPHNGTKLWNWSYTLTEADWTKLGAAGANNVRKSIHLRSHSTQRGTDSIEVTGEFFIDTVAPSFSSPIRLEVDSGVPGDRITNNGKIIVPAPEAGVNWSYQIDSGEFQTGSGNSFVVPEGRHTVTVRQTDGAGNSTAQTLTVTVDTTPPLKSTVALKDDTGDLPNDFITRTGLVKVTGLEPGVRWQHRSGITGAWIDHGPADAADTEHIVDLSAGADGERRIEVRQIDAAGNESLISNELVFTLDRTGPVLTLQLAQDTGTAGDGITYNGTVQVNGLEAGRAWTYQIDGGEWIEVSAGLNTVVVPGLKTGSTDGLRKVRVKQTDAAGNETVSSELSFTLDTIDPVFTTDIRLQQDTGIRDNDGITSNGRIIVPAPEAGATWSYRIDDGSFRNGGSSNSFEVPEGRHNVTVRMTDVAGNNAEQTKTVTVDTRAPAAPTLSLVSDTGDLNNDRYTSNGNVRVSGLEPGASWKYKIGASTYLPGSTTNSFDATPGSDGERQVSVIQIDEAGNESVAAELNFTLDRIGPSLVLSLLNKTGSTAAAITRDGTVKVDGLEAGRAWQYQIGEGTWQNGSGTSFVVPGANASGGSDGVKKVRVRQTDVAGNESITPQFEFTLDTTAPVKPVLALVRDTAGVVGSSVITLDTDKITSDGRVRISNIEAGSKVEYSLNNTDWLVLTGDTLTLTGDGSKQVWMRQTDVAGNVSTVSDRFDFTLDTVATKPSVRLVNDTGDTRLPGVATDKLTRDGTVEVLGLEPGATWQYKLDDGNWQNGSSTTLTLGGSEGTKRVVVRQTDKAGNASAESEALEFILDRIAPVAPTLSKVAAVLSGGKTYSKDRSFTVSGLDADGLAEYRLGDGAWVRLTGNSFTLPATQADGEYRVAVRQSDKAGNVSPNAEVTFTLDTVASAPTLQLNNPAGTNPAGEALTTAASFVLSGVAEKGAQVTVRNGSKEVGTAIASVTDGSWSLTVNSTLEITGLRRVDGELSAANGVYQLLTLGQVSALPAFHADFSISGNNVIDTSRPAYRMTTAIGENWYLWSALNGDYRISRQSGADEWHREILNSPEQTAFPENTTSLMAMNTNFATVQTELETNGSSTHQRLLKRSDISLISSNSPRALHEFSATQTDVVGNTSVASATRKVRIDTLPPALLDMDASTAGIQGASTLEFTLSQLNTGINLVGNVAPPESTDIETILVRFTAQGSNRATNQLMVSGTTLFMKDNLALLNNQTIGTVSGLSFSYDATGATLTVRKSNALQALTGNEVERILEAIKIKNTAGSIASGERYRAEVVLQDIAKQNGILSSVTSLNIVNNQPMLDMDTSLAGVQHQSKVKYQNIREPRTAFVTDLTATSSANEIRISKRGFDEGQNFFTDQEQIEVDNGSNVSGGGIGVVERIVLYDNNTPFVGTIGGVSNVRLNVNSNSGIIGIVRNGGGEFSANEIVAIIKHIHFISLSSNENQFDLSLVKNGVAGPVSSVYVTTRNFAPPLDLDATTAGTQLVATRIINLAGQTEGASLFAKPIATPRDDDTKSIQLSFTNGTLAVTLDKLVLGSYTLAFDTSAPANLVQTIAGVRDVAISYTRTSGSANIPPLVLTKTDGSSFTSEQVKAVLEGLQFKTTSTDATARLIDITLTDQAGNTSAPARARITLDRDPPPQTLSLAIVNDNQVSYDVLEFNGGFGANNTFVFNSEDDPLNIPLPSGVSAADFLKNIRGLSAVWGGKGIAATSNNDGANLLNENVKSYLGFNVPPRNDVSFSFSHQGGTYVKGDFLKFVASAGGLTLHNLRSFNRQDSDLYNFDGTNTASAGGLYAIGKIKLLYEVSTTATTNTPTFSIGFDHRNATVGGLMEIYDGSRLVASKRLTAADINDTDQIRLTVTESLSKGEHQFTAKYSEVSGDESKTEVAVPLNVTREGVLPFLSDLKVQLPYPSAKPAQALGTSKSSYAVFVDPDAPGRTNNYEQGPTITGKVGTLLSNGTDAGGTYLVQVSMGGKLLGFDVVSGGNFTVRTGASQLAPGFYDDLSVTATNITPNSEHKGMVNSVQGLALGYYWAPQSLGNVKGGAGNDEILLGRTAGGAATEIETGNGQDVLTLSNLGRTGSLEATITDFRLGTDRIRIMAGNGNNGLTYRDIRLDNLENFAPASQQSASGTGTKLVIDLDGLAGGDKYTLYLQNVTYNASNTHTLFGV
ncbi:Ig-like domain-containing protein [Herbaspirillum sp. CAH-3]|uniref:Ig-like domain-containing protein n=1 Tax=Herbaspirillum sp. CAH-3 TaxID=2605746 RepID=UPI0012ACE5A3|nr:Ig-like domain-containing protein [Herbaspirillum sp. CAH-3]MRT29523.1 cell wall anchor protein [Herbaspirillum sp. CAH-3]